jgi:L,D-peptidoglycan transpeptidase YkuD (ErfK/YbiS/YcfS/YnhG family)
LLSTSAAVVAIAGCAAVVLVVANAQPKGAPSANISPLPSTSSAVSSSAPMATVPLPVPNADGQHSEAAKPVAPAPKTTASSVPPPQPVRAAPPAAHVSTTHAAPPPPPTKTSVPAVTHSAAARPKQPPAPAVQRGVPLPLGYSTGNASRVITVVAGSTGSTTATLQAWQAAPGGGWLRHGSSILAHIGSDGMTTHPSESLSATPIGSFTLTQAFGSAGNPGTSLPYFQTNSDDWWVSDVNSPAYNTHQHCSACSFNTGAGENLYQAGYVYTYAVVIDYNRFPVTAGAGSAFFLHVTDGNPTAGCVSIPENDLVPIMQWLSPSAHPRILIGTG